MNFVFVSLQRINTDRESTSTSLAKELSKHHNVLYVNPPIDRRTLFSNGNDQYTKAHVELIKQNENELLKITDSLSVLNPSNILESINWIPNTALFSFFNKINNKRFAKDIQNAIEKLAFDTFILINDKDIFRSFYLKELLKPKLYIYLDRDYTLGIDYWKKHGSKLEPELIKKSDAVVCNSPDFAKNDSIYNSRSFYIGNGGDVSSYYESDYSEVPKALKSINAPIIGYVGALNALRLDINLLLEISEKRKDWNIVLVGPDDEVFRKSGLYEKPNVYYIGPVHKNEIPNYIAHFNVCINPQLINKITIGNFPLKIIEYLALGKPIVATETNTMKDIFPEYVYLAIGVDDYVKKIQYALEQDPEIYKDARIEFSKDFSWEKITKNLMDCIYSIEKSSAKPD